jgi:hypothetical protein
MPSKPVKTVNSPTTNHILQRLRDFKRNFKEYVLLFIFCSPVLIPVVTAMIYVPCYRASLKKAEFTVASRERVTSGSGDGSSSYYLVWSKEGEVFCVTDSWSFLRFDSSDRYGKLREGSHVMAHVAGWRVPFLSWYRNVVEIDDAGVKEPSE